MNQYEYKDEKGAVILTASSSHPAFVVTPPDMQPEDAAPITGKEFKNRLTKAEKDVKIKVDPIKALIKEVNDLQARIDLLESKVKDGIQH